MSGFALFLQVLNLLANPATLLTGGWRYLVDFFGTRTPLSIWPPALQRVFNQFPWLRDNVAILTIAALYAWFNALMGLVVAYTGVVSRPFIRAIEENEQNQIPSLPELLNIATTNVPMLGPDGTLQSPRLLATQHGLHPNYFDALYAANGQIPSPGQLLELLNRQAGGAIRGAVKYTTQYVEDALRESALKDKFIPDLMELRFQLLTASDYIRLAVRDVFVPAKRAELTLDAEYPEILSRKMEAIGVSDGDARDLWAAHWDLPSPTQVYEMLHRQIIKEKDVATYLASADYAPTWRQKLIDISYNPITRTDAKRAYKIRAPGFDDARLVTAFRELGYTVADATLLMEFVKQDVSEENRQERELLVGPVRSAALAMYKARRISEAELRSTLANLKYPLELVDRFVADVQFSRDAEQRDDVAAALKGAYVKTLRSREDTRAMLLTHGWDTGGADDLLEVWDILRQTTELSPTQSAARDLTRADIVTGYADNLISEADARAMIIDLGYDDAETAVIIGRAILNRDRAERAINVELAHANYVSGTIDPGQTSILLDGYGVPANQRAALLVRWAAERDKRIPDFPVKLIEDLVKARVIDYTQASDYLQQQSYTPAQRGQLLQFWTGRSAESEAKARAKPTTGGVTPLRRNDYETLYLSDRSRRAAAEIGLATLGYSPANIQFILDAIDRTRM